VYRNKRWCRERRQEERWKQGGGSKKYRLTRPLTSAYVYHRGHCRQRELAHPAPSAAIELQFSTRAAIISYLPTCRYSTRRSQTTAIPTGAQMIFQGLLLFRYLR